MNRYKSAVNLLKIFDMLLICLAGLGSLWLVSLTQGQWFAWWHVLPADKETMVFMALVTFLPVYHLTALCLYLYAPGRLDTGTGEWKTLALAVGVAATVFCVGTWSLSPGHIAFPLVLIFPGLSYGLLRAGRFMMRTFLGEIHKPPERLKNLVLVGCNGRTADFVAYMLARPRLGYRIIGFIDDVPWVRGYQGLSLKYLGPLQDFDAVLDMLQVDEVVVTLPLRSFYEQINRIVETCEIQGITVHLLSHFFPLKIARVHVTELEGMPLLTFRTGALSDWQAGLKRGFDMLVSAGLLVVLAPLFLLTALLIKISSPDGPVFFVQTRVGHNRRHFKMVKFRTMIPDAEEKQKELEQFNEAQGAVFKIKHDPRITPIGRILRKTSIDELPQLLNVLKGDMSLVGPRPLPLRDAARFDEKWLQRRWSVKPGLTCLWQVNGRQHDNFHAWIQQDLAYIDQWSFGLDLKILAKTIPVVLRGDGAH